MKIKQPLRWLGLLLALLCGHAHAASLSLVPGAVTTTPGGTFSINLVVTGLGDGGAPSLGAFDLDIGFNPADLSLVGVTLQAQLGDVGLGEALDVSFGTLAPGWLNIAEVSLLSVGELDSLQGDTVILAALEFAASGLGAGDTTTVSILDVWSLGDAQGDPIPVESLGGAVVTAIPVPAALWLMVGAISCLGLVQSARR